MEARIGPELPTTTYLDRSGKQKRVRYWAMTVAGGEPAGGQRGGRGRLGAARRGPGPADLSPATWWCSTPCRRRGVARRGRARCFLASPERRWRGRAQMFWRQEADHVLEAEPQRHQAHGDPDHVGADPGPAPGPVDQEAHPDPQDSTTRPRRAGRAARRRGCRCRGCWPPPGWLPTWSGVVAVDGGRGGRPAGAAGWRGGRPRSAGTWRRTRVAGGQGQLGERGRIEDGHVARATTTGVAATPGRRRCGRPCR